MELQRNAMLEQQKLEARQQQQLQQQQQQMAMQQQQEEEEVPDVSSLAADMPSHPALKNAQLAKSVVDTSQAAALGLPKGTMWFDPSDPAQMQMIKEQLEGKPTETPAPPGPGTPPKAKAPCKVRLLKEEDLPAYRQILHVPEDCDSQAQVLRCYKRRAPSLHPSVKGDADDTELKKLTESCQACLAELRRRATAKVGELGTIGEEEDEEEDASPKKGDAEAAPEGFLLVDDVDALEFYDETFYHKQKHAQLKVKMGVALEDFVLGHTAGESMCSSLTASRQHLRRTPFGRV